MIIPQPLPKNRESLLVAKIHHTLTAYAAGDSSAGYDVLRYFLKGWIAHQDADIQADLALFAFATDMYGTIIPENSKKGYLILRAAKAGLLIARMPAFTPPTA